MSHLFMGVKTFVKFILISLMFYFLGKAGNIATVLFVGFLPSL